MRGVFTFVSCLFALGFCAQAFAEPAPAVVLQSAVDRAVATTTDVVTFTLTLKHRLKVKKLELPDVGGQLGGMRVIDFGLDEPVIEDEYRIVKRWYKLQADISGSYVIPAIEISYQDAAGKTKSVKTAEIFLEIHPPSATVAGDQKDDQNKPRDIRDIKSLAPLGLHPIWKYTIVFFSILILASAVFFALRWVKRRKKIAVAPPSPEEIAARQLAQLKEIDLADARGVKKYHFGLSEILRAYFEGRFTLPATDRTTEELTQQIAALEQIEEEDKALFLETLRKTDRVKFTDFLPAKDSSLSLLSDSERFISNTAPHEQVSEESSAAEGESVL